jgi:hypothetical protein
VVTVVLSLVADNGRFHFQAAKNLCELQTLKFTTAPAIKFNTCYLLGLVFTFKSTLLFPVLALTRFCFLGRKKSAGKQTSSFAIFGFRVGLCELQMCLTV